MNRLTQLEVKKMMKEFEYLISELDYKNELVSDVDNKFITTVNDFLNQHPDLKQAFDETMERRMKDTLNYHESRIDSEGNYIPAEEEIIVPEIKRASAKVKKMYREVVKLTHPDKVNDVKLNELYIDASKHYDEDDLFSMYTLYEKLGIDYQIDEDDIILLSDRISEIKEKINLLESTTTWIWHSAEDECFRRDMVVRYILNQIR